MRGTKIAILFDGSRMNSMAKALQVFVDYNRVLEWAGNLERDSDVVSAKFFTQLPAGDHPIYKTIDFLQFNGWQVVERNARMVQGNDPNGREIMSGDMDTYIVAECVKLAHLGGVDRVIIFSGSGDLVPGVDALREKLIAVDVVGIYKDGERSFISPDLRRAVSGHVIELADIADDISRNQSVGGEH